MKTNIYGAFSLRAPLNEDETLLAKSHGVVFLCDPQGNDWYGLLKQFSDETVKIAFDESGLINSASYDASTMWPQSFSVAEVSDCPDTFLSQPGGGKWVFDGESIEARVLSAAELTEQAKATRDALLAEASQKISPLQDAKELDIATDDELSQLREWMLYRVQLSRIDSTLAPDITWPEIPN
jgi:hypothetical protein